MVEAQAPSIARDNVRIYVVVVPDSPVVGWSFAFNLPG